MKTLLLDIGNTRIKPAWSDADGLIALAPAAHQGDPAAALEQMDIDAPARLLIASVHGAVVEAALINMAWTQWQIVPEFARSGAQFAGLRNAYDEPERLGVDRWLAMLASRSEPGAALIIDAGTALTADVIDTYGQHRGGFIAAGLLTSQKAVLGATRFDTRDSAAAYDGGLGANTESCVRQGAMLSCLGAIDRADTLAEKNARRLITGGDAALLLPHLAGEWEHRPNLVLEGLRAWSLAASESV